MAPSTSNHDDDHAAGEWSMALPLKGTYEREDCSYLFNYDVYCQQSLLAIDPKALFFSMRYLERTSPSVVQSELS